ncbi:hypothetical protein BC835DRAFT_545503 [Cytidiella melzeri]|nr:hypothetical protein BC835DRAFT_545503 [Cytidiella melzeri]
MAANPDALWTVGQEVSVHGTGGDLYNPAFLKTIEVTIRNLDKELRELSLDISGWSCPT